MYSAAALTVVTLIVVLARHRTLRQKARHDPCSLRWRAHCPAHPHGKKRVIAPVMDPALGRRVEWMDVFDTLHFTREVPASTQLNVARRAAPASRSDECNL